MFCSIYLQPLLASFFRQYDVQRQAVCANVSFLQNLVCAPVKPANMDGLPMVSLLHVTSMTEPFNFLSNHFNIKYLFYADMYFCCSQYKQDAFCYLITCNLPVTPPTIERGQVFCSQILNFSISR